MSTNIDNISFRYLIEDDKLGEKILSSVLSETKGMIKYMFEIDYRIVHNEYDDFAGQYGFFQIKCNGYTYGEMYPKEIEEIMDKVSLYDWFERLVKVIKNLMAHDYVALSDVESYNTWIVFQKRNKQVVVSIAKAKKEPGSKDIEFFLRKSEAGEWANQIIIFEQLKEEIVKKGREYIETILLMNKATVSIDKIKGEFDEISES